MKPPICFLSGRYVETRKATIPALDRGFLFGEGLFETWCTYRGRPFALREHLKRMATSARAIGIPFDPSEDWAGRTLELARRNGMLGCGGAVRLTITRGPGPVTLVPAAVQKPTQLMLFRPLEPGLAEARRDGVAIHLLDFGKGVNPNLRKLKTLNYLPAVMGKIAARDRGCFESLYVLQDGSVLEGTTSNFFIVKRGRLITTPIEHGILPGVTRALVMKIAGRLLPIEERRLAKQDLYDADEMFITSSTIEVVPVLRVGRRRVGHAAPGAVTRELQARYRRYVARRLGMRVEELG